MSSLILQVLATMEQLEKVSSFQEFVQIFSQFGNEMVEFAHLTGDRQNVSTIKSCVSLRYHFHLIYWKIWVVLRWLTSVLSLKPNFFSSKRTSFDFKAQPQKYYCFVWSAYLPEAWVQAIWEVIWLQSLYFGSNFSDLILW